MAGAAMVQGSHGMRKTNRHWIELFSIAPLFVCGCDPNSTASLGGEEAGDRGNVRVLFINNTSEQAVFTVGTFDRLDQASQPDFEQFGVDSGDRPLPANSSSVILSLDCGRVLGIGSPMLLNLISENLPDVTMIDDAFVSGVMFRHAPATDNQSDADNANESTGNVNANQNVNDDASVDNASNDNGEAPAGQDQPAVVGTAPPFEAMLGVDFPCNSLVIIRFEIDDVGPDPYRIDFQVIPSESTR
jgi:hypothetical protein